MDGRDSVVSKQGKGHKCQFGICFKWKKTKECIVLVFSNSKRAKENVKGKKLDAVARNFSF